MGVSGVSQLSSSLGQSQALRLDDQTPVIYIGTAPPNTLDAQASWSIKRLTTTGSLLTIEWANGNDSNNNVWSNRASLSYS